MYIYGLIDPITQELRYIGFTVQTLRARLSKHISDVKKETTHKANWIKSLLNKGLKPEIFLLQETNKNEWKEDEQWNIAYFKSIGCRLTNHTLGGDGTLGYKFTPDQLSNMSRAQ